MAKDLFSDQSKSYALHRPVYPEELFNYIIFFVKEKNTAWDCATGKGQSAIPLSHHFQKVFATDISPKQLEQAPAKENIEYVVCPAEETVFSDNLFDLITCSQAYHWLHWKKFHEEVMRVGKPNCIIAVWMYDLVSCKEEKLNKLIRHFYTNITGPYWDAERKHVDDHYANLPFDFEPLPSKKFTIEINYTKEQLLGYFFSWSATQNFINSNGYSPVEEIKNDLYQLWPQDVKTFHFPLILKLGRINK